MYTRSIQEKHSIKEKKKKKKLKYYCFKNHMAEIHKMSSSYPKHLPVPLSLEIQKDVGEGEVIFFELRRWRGASLEKTACSHLNHSNPILHMMDDLVPYNHPTLW